MTRNLRTQLANAAERWMRAWAGDDLARESAEVLYTYWDLADPNDDELRDEVLSRFPAWEPPAVPGKDFLPPSPHGFTSHGHPCCSSAVGPGPDMRARCNGVVGCRDCQASAARIHAGGVS